MTATDSPTPLTKGLVLRAAQAGWYDLLAAVLTLGRDRQLRERLAELARLAPGEAVLDVGCGTGTLALAARRAVGAGGTVVGIDASPDMLALATRKAARAGADVEFRNAAAERLPFADATFDSVLSTLMLHHLPAPLRRECVREALRVLKPGGRVLAVDFATPAPRKGGLLAHLHRHGGLSSDVVVALLRDAGFHVEETGAVGVSDLHYARAVKPPSGRMSSPADDAPAHRSLAPLRRPRWVLPVAVGVAIAAHAWMGQQLAARVTLSAAGLAIAAIGVIGAIGAIGAIVLWLHLARSRR